MSYNKTKNKKKNKTPSHSLSLSLSLDLKCYKKRGKKKVLSQGINQTTDHHCQSINTTKNFAHFFPVCFRFHFLLCVSFYFSPTLTLFSNFNSVAFRIFCVFLLFLVQWVGGYLVLLALVYFSFTFSLLLYVRS